jgi:hypothetical protein
VLGIVKERAEELVGVQAKELDALMVTEVHEGE